MIKEILIVILAMFLVASCNEKAIGNVYVFNGAMSMESMRSLSQTFQLNPDIDTVEFRDSLGTPSYALLVLKEVNKSIYERKTKTLVKGRCMSMCAFAFLLGSSRQMLASDRNYQTYLFIHPIWDTESREIIYGQTERILDQIAERSGNSKSREMLEIIFDVKNEKGGLYIFRNPIGFGVNAEKYHAYFCDGTEERDPKKCKPVPGITPGTLGVVVQDGK